MEGAFDEEFFEEEVSEEGVFDVGSCERGMYLDEDLDVAESHDADLKSSTSMPASFLSLSRSSLYVITSSHCLF